MAIGDKHYNKPDRFRFPWEDAGLRRTRTAGLRRLWLLAPTEAGGTYWMCALAGEGATSGQSREEALARGVAW